MADKLYCSLLCGLKNEIDFGLKVATLLANSKEAEWISDFKFIDVLIESCHLYSCSCDELLEDDDNSDCYLDKYCVYKDNDKGSNKCIDTTTTSASSNKPIVNGTSFQPLSTTITTNSTSISHTNNTNNNTSNNNNMIINSSVHSSNTDFNKIMVDKDCKCMHKFWSGLGVDKFVVDLACTNHYKDIREQFAKKQKQVKKKSVNEDDDRSNSNAYTADSDADNGSDDVMFDENDNDLTEDNDDEHMDRKYCTFFEIQKFKSSPHEKIYRTVKSISEIIRNLSFNMEQVDKHKSSSPLDVDDGGSVVQFSNNFAFNCATLNLMKFLVLLISCKDQYLNNIGLDILSNIASSIDVNNSNRQNRRCLELLNRHCIDSILSSNDINCINRCLEITSKIVPKYKDEPIECLSSSFLHHKMLQRLTELLTCQHDIILVISSLECLRAISDFCPQDLVKECPHLLKILLSLLNCDASIHFTKSALARVKIIDERRKTVPEPEKKTLYITGQKSTASLDNEAFINLWLRGSYEAKPGAGKSSSLKLSDIYEDYVKYSLKCTRKNVISSSSFPMMVKRCFPTCTIVDATHVEGLLQKLSNSNVSTPIKVITSGGTGSGVASPILKAHLSAPPKSNGPPSTTSTSGTVTTSTSTLIKNLLANKLRTGSQGISSSNSSTTTSITFSSLTAGCVTVTPATSMASSSLSSASTSTTNTTTTIIPCSINNLSLNSLKFNPHRPSSPGPAAPTYERPKTVTDSTTTSKTQTTMEVSPLTTMVPTCVITSVSSSKLTTSPRSTNSNATTIIVTTTIPTGSVNSQTNSTTLSTDMIVTPAITSTPLLVTSGESINTQSFSTGTTQVSASLASVISSPSSIVHGSTPSTGHQESQVLFSAASQPSSNAQANQPQQFLLVRTIIGNQPQTGLVGVPNTGTPVRLILPSNFLAQQRPIHAQQGNITVNGVSVSSSKESVTGQIRLNPATMTMSKSNKQTLAISSTSSAQISSVITNATASLTSPPTTSTTSSPGNSCANDILLKAVLGSGIVSESSPLSGSTSSTTNSLASTRANTVKSSPLLNVLLDKGRLPDFSTMAGTNNQTNSSAIINSPISLNQISVSSHSSSAIANSSNSITSPATKMYIITTRSSLPTRSLQTSNSPLISRTSTLAPPPAQPQPIIVASSQQTQPVQHHSRAHQVNTTFSSNVKETSVVVSDPVKVNNTTVTICPNPISSSSTSEAAISKTIPPKTSVTDIAGSNEQVKVDETKQNLVIEGLSNGEVTIDPVTVLPSRTVSNVSADLSSIRDICKTMDDATKLISKRSNDDLTPSMNAAKKIKLNANVNSICVANVKTVNHMDTVLACNTDQEKSNIISCDKVTSSCSSSSLSPSLSQVSNSSASTASYFQIGEDETNCKASNGISCDPNPTPTISSSNSSSSTSDATITVSTSAVVSAIASSKNIFARCNTTNEKPTITIKLSNNDNFTSTSNKSVSLNSASNKSKEYMCEWHGCKRLFPHPSQVYWHVHKEHVNIYDDSSENMSCQWGGPEGLGPGCRSTRPKLSLLTHIHDFHCNPSLLQQAALRRGQSNSSTTTNITPTIIPPAHPGYAANAAILAIRRHAVNYVEPVKPPPVTAITPISTSIRITAALILRNLAQVSLHIRSILQTYEPYLTELCISEGRDESRTLAQCLSYMVDRER